MSKLGSELLPEISEGEARFLLVLTLTMGDGWRLIVDDRKVHSWAKRLGIWIGKTRVLVRGKRAGVIPSVKPLLEVLQQKGFFVSIPR
jgi:predicted nucleic acid-binding protein